MSKGPQRPSVRCAIYTRVSSDQGLEQDFNSLDAQREACSAYIRSQASEGWKALPKTYDDGGYSGGSLERPAVQQLLEDIRSKKIDIVVVYKVDRLTRSLADFAKLVELFDGQGVSFVSVTQSFNTTTSMGRLTLNVLLSFAQFEREVTGERIRDKIAASKKKGLWVGGVVPLGYRVENKKLIVDKDEAATVRIDLRTLSRARLIAGLAAGPARQRHPHQDKDTFIWARSRWHPAHQWTAQSYSAQPGVFGGDQPSGRKLPRGTSALDRARTVRSRSGETLGELGNPAERSSRLRCPADRQAL